MVTWAVVGQCSAEVGWNCVQAANSKFCSDRSGLEQLCSNEGFGLPIALFLNSSNATLNIISHWGSCEVSRLRRNVIVLYC